MFAESFHQKAKCGPQRDHILQDLIGLEISISMKASKTENRFQTSFQQPKSGLQKEPELTSVIYKPFHSSGCACALGLGQPLPPSHGTKELEMR